jgi:hypothetical protein
MVFVPKASVEPDAAVELEVTGAIDMRACNGTYQAEKGHLRNGRPCFSKKGGGAIYFDGSYWKMCQDGCGRSESGWNFSQRPTDSKRLPPLGRWVPEARTSEASRDYSQLEVKIVGQLNRPSTLTLHTA